MWVTSVHVVAIGGKGGNGEAPGPNDEGGYGATVTADLQIPQDVQTLYIEVGGNGGSTVSSLTGGAGGANGGGASGNSNGSFATGGGGGGASDVRTCSLPVLPTTCVTLDSRLLVAAGGGGGGSADAAGGNAMEGTGEGAGTNTTILNG